MLKFHPKKLIPFAYKNAVNEVTKNYFFFGIKIEITLGAGFLHKTEVNTINDTHSTSQLFVMKVQEATDYVL